MKALLRTIALSATLAALSWVFTVGAAHLLVASSILLLPTLAVWLTVFATPPQRQHWVGRVAFWALALVGWLAVALLAQGRWENQPDERQNLLFGFGVALFVAAWLGVKSGTFPKWHTLRELTAAAAVLVLAGGAFVWAYDAKTRTIAARAEARWTEIGMPMAAFEKTLAPSHENAGSAVVRQALRDLVRTRFYKEGTAAAERELPIESEPANHVLISNACDIISAKLSPADDFDLLEQPTAAIESIAPALDETYRRILATEPAVWAANPADGFAMNAPNFLGIRKFSQLAAADATRRLAAGDHEGAARAIAAGQRLGEKLPENPTLVALMIRVATECLFTPKTVRFPASEDGLAALARDVAAKRAALVRTLQMESWSLLRLSPSMRGDAELVMPFNKSLLPKWAARFVSQHYEPRQWRVAAANYPEHAAIQTSPETFTAPDLGSDAHEQVSTRNPSCCEQNIIRSAKRIHATLLLREQTELIRLARARLAAGLPVESRESIVLPATRWELTADATKNTVTTRLTNAPEWIMKGHVTGNDFWILPLDGSTAWQFRPPTHTASAQSER